ncbi:MAG: hypothetical protein ACOYL3_05535 [Desulfuromonadaceae bacterium]
MKIFTSMLAILVAMAIFLGNPGKVEAAIKCPLPSKPLNTAISSFDCARQNAAFALSLNNGGHGEGSLAALLKLYLNRQVTMRF